MPQQERVILLSVNPMPKKDVNNNLREGIYVEPWKSSFNESEEIPSLSSIFPFKSSTVSLAFASITIVLPAKKDILAIYGNLVILLSVSGIEMRIWQIV